MIVSLSLSFHKALHFHTHGLLLALRQIAPIASGRGFLFDGMSDVMHPQAPLCQPAFSSLSSARSLAPSQFLQVHAEFSHAILEYHLLQGWSLSHDILGN